METAESVTTDALQEILVQASEAPLEPDERATAIRYMNRFMARLAAKGVNLGYTKVTNISDSITIPDGAIDGLVKNLAISLASQFDGVVSQSLRTEAKDALQAMYDIAVQLNNTFYPGTLPIGSGNEWELQDNNHFYPEQGTGILGEQTGPILVEDDTENP